MFGPVREVGGRPTVRELWAELSATMRVLRQRSGVSLRQAELASGRGRGTLSQIENGKAHPGRDLVEWYDTAFSGDGLLLSLYAEARGAHGPSSRPQAFPHIRPGDVVKVEETVLAEGELVPCGADVVAGWVLFNAGSVPWSGRRLERVGAHTAVRLIGSPRATPIPDCEPGDRTRVEFPISVPDVAGTFAAHWIVVDADGRRCYEPSERLRVLITARPE